MALDRCPLKGANQVESGIRAEACRNSIEASELGWAARLQIGPIGSFVNGSFVSGFVRALPLYGPRMRMASRTGGFIGLETREPSNHLVS